MQIGLLEDDTSQIELLRMWTKESGDNLQAFTTGSGFRQALSEQEFDLLIIDWHLPDTTGIDELDWLRKDHQTTAPVIFITSRDSEESVIQALDHGADDYMVKPVNKGVTLSRIRALQRRTTNIKKTTNDEFVNAETQAATAEDTEQFDPFEFNQRQQKVFKSGKEITLTNKEFKLATYLFRNAGSLVTRDFLLSYIWGIKAELKTRTVDTHISRIRSKLGISPDIGWQLNSIYQRGYRLTRIM